MAEIKGYTPIFDKDKTATYEEWMQKLSEHNTENPSHGTNCVCMDEFCRELKKMFPLPRAPYGDADFSKWLEGPENKLRHRMRYVFSMFIRNMDYM